MTTKLKRGYTFYYNNQQWKVTEVYKIKWKDGTHSREYKVKSKQAGHRFLEIEIDAKKGEHYSFWSKIADNAVLDAQFKQISGEYVGIKKAKFPKELVYQGITYHYSKHHDGHCTYDDGEKERVNAIDYANKEGDKLLSIEVWDDEVEVSTGIPITKAQISQIAEGKLGLLEGVTARKSGGILAFIIVGGFILMTGMLQKCTHNNSFGDNNNYSKDSTQVNRSNNHYRGRSSRGFGK